MAEEARDVAERSGETANLGEAHAWLGRISAARGDADATDSEFEAAFKLFELVGAPERMTRNRAIYADILESRGDLVGANRQLKLAIAAVGSSGLALGDSQTATA